MKRTRAVSGVAVQFVTAIFVAVIFSGHSDADKFQGLGDLPGGDFESHAYGVSADGTTVVGDSFSANGDKEAFKWTDADGIQGLGDLQSTRADSRANAASRDGTVIVGSGRAGTKKSTMGSGAAFRWTKSEGMNDLGSLPSRYPSGMAQDVSADGRTIVGFSMSGESARREAFRWTKAIGMKGLGGLIPYKFGGSIANAISGDGTTIVGSSESTGGAFRWTEAEGMQGLGALPKGGVSSDAVDVSGDGSIVVGIVKFRGTKQMAFRWSKSDGIQVLDDLPGGHENCTATAISDDGAIIVGAGYSVGGSEAVRWTKSGGVKSIRQLLVDQGIDMTGWQLWSATDVSADGKVIVGYGTNRDKKWEAWRAELSISPSQDKTVQKHQ